MDFLIIRAKFEIESRSILLYSQRLVICAQIPKKLSFLLSNYLRIKVKSFLMKSAILPLCQQEIIIEN